MKKLILLFVTLVFLGSCEAPKPVAMEPAMVPVPAEAVQPVVTPATPEVVKHKLLGVHTVVPSDTLWYISGKWYNDPVLWPSIYEINKDQIKDPDLIYPGQKFDIPALKTDGKLSADDNALLQQGYLEAYRVYKEKGKSDAEDYKTEAGNYK